MVVVAREAHAEAADGEDALMVAPHQRVTPADCVATLAVASLLVVPAITRDSGALRGGLAANLVVTAGLYASLVANRAAMQQAGAGHTALELAYRYAAQRGAVGTNAIAATALLLLAISTSLSGVLAALAGVSIYGLMVSFQPTAAPGGSSTVSDDEQHAYPYAVVASAWLACVFVTRYDVVPRSTTAARRTVRYGGFAVVALHLAAQTETMMLPRLADLSAAAISAAFFPTAMAVSIDASAFLLRSFRRSCFFCATASLCVALLGVPALGPALIECTSGLSFAVLLGAPACVDAARWWTTVTNRRHEVDDGGGARSADGGGLNQC